MSADGAVVSVESSSAQARRSNLLQVVRRMGWGVADQGISSISNFALSLFVARTLSAADFGAFTLAYITYSVAINAARGVATDPLLVRLSGAVRRPWRRATSAAAGTALSVGIVIGLVCIVVGLLLPSRVGMPFVALGVGLPGLTLQDSWRFAFFACGRGVSSFINDFVWTVLLLGALVLLHSQGRTGAVICLITFGATASLAAVFGSLQAGVLPRPARTLDWLRDQRHLSGRYLVENVSSSGASQLRSFVLGAVASLAAVGYVRAAEILMGPFLVVLMGLSQVAVPETSRVFRTAPARLSKFCFGLGAVQATGALLWGAALLIIFPLGPGQLLLKGLWTPASHLVPAVTLTVAVTSFSTAAAAGLRAMGVSRRSMRAQLSASTLYVLGGSLGAVIDGAVGTCWGVATAQTIAALLWWHQLRSALAQHDQLTQHDQHVRGD